MAIKTRLAAAGAGTILIAAGALIYPREGEIRNVYKDAVGVLTACVGHTSPNLRLGQYFSEEECTQHFIADMETAYKAVRRCTPTAPERSLPALISFTFNVGSGAYCSSGLARKMNAGNPIAACQELYRWVYAKGRVLPGLVKRRAEEAESCIAGAMEAIHG